MASFYGGGALSGTGGGSGSGGGTQYNTIYNTIYNTVANQAGSQTEPTTLSTLDYGIYTFDGKYTISDDDTTIKQTDGPVVMTVYKDEDTNEKCVQFYTSEEHTVYLNALYYDNAGNLVYTKKTPIEEGGQEDWHEFGG